MKFSAYPVQEEGDTITVLAGSVVDLDLQGGLEETLMRLLDERRPTRLRLVLSEMRFLHATLTACLLHVSDRMKLQGGTLELVDAPQFVLMMMRQWGVAHRFVFSESRTSRDRVLNDLEQARSTASELIEQIRRGSGGNPFA